MSKRELIAKEIEALGKEGAEIAIAFQAKKNSPEFSFAYQSWYTKALRVVSSLAPDRSLEFRSYYEINPNRKVLGYGTYVIQDFLKGVAPNDLVYENFDTRRQVMICLTNQLAIFTAIRDRLNSILGDIEGELFAEL
ncbi:MAG TPA: hypothetical protein VFB28_02415 [Terriglobales bacterium]|nr:hypothetical protein [Terriglobales bacterium]